MVGTVGLATLFTGNLQMSVAHVGTFVFGYSIWAVLVGALLCRSRRSAGA